jgi:glyoxylase-like metal-dependent hydrolase (beta-lactamase superfamily II)
LKIAREVASGIFLIELPLPFELESVNVYLARLDEGYLLIDCGMQLDAAFETLQAGVRELGIGWRNIRLILLTHMHPDHMGMTARLLELSGAKLIMHETEAEHLREVARAGRRLPWIDLAFDHAGVPDESRARMDRHFRDIRRNFYELTPDRLLCGGEEIETAEGPLEALWTPGHSPGHLCLYSRGRKILFSGDQILERITPNIAWHPERDTLGDFLTSLERLREIEVDLILPSHGPPFSGHRAWIAQTAAHHAERCDEIAGLIAETPRTAFGLVGELWRKPLSPINHHFAVFEVLAHLEYMRRLGRAHASTGEGAINWSAG